MPMKRTKKKNRSMLVGSKAQELISSKMNNVEEKSAI
jgi:hypothetical protein